MRKGPLKTFLRGRKHPTDLILTIVFALIGAISTQIFDDGSIVRILLALPLLLFLPGYAMVSMMFPARNIRKPRTDKDGAAGRSLDITERVIFSIGLSIVLVSLTGLALNYVSSITLVPILTSLLGITVAFTMVAWYLRDMLPSEERFRVSFLVSSQTKDKVSEDKRFTAVLVCCIVLVASVLIYLVANPVDNAAYSEFYLLDKNGGLTALPNNLTVNQTGIVFVTIRSHENEARDYRIIASVENVTTPLTYVNDGSQVVLSSNNRVATDVTLNDGGTFEQEYGLSFPAPGKYKIVWVLQIDGLETEYRLHFWVNVV